MSGIAINQLTSRAIRSRYGQRIIKGLQSESKQGNIITTVFNFGKQLLGFITGVLGGITFSFAALWGVLVRSVSFIWNFNFNATDAQLQQRINSALVGISSQLGGTLGNAVGYVTCGLLPGAAIFAFNEPLGALILKNVSEEGGEEFLENVQVLARSTFSLGTQVLITWLYTNTRKLIKSQGKAIGNLFGSKVEDAIESWGAEGSQHWSFAEKVEEKVESIPNELVRNFVEEFLEEAWDGCIEAGYVVASTIDSYIAQQKLEEELKARQTDVVVIEPNRAYPDERVILSGNGIDLKNQITSALVQHQVLGARDLGIIYGTDDEQPVRSLKPEVVLKFYENKEDRLAGKKTNGQKAARPNPLTMRISFRLMDKSEEDFKTDVYVKTLAQRIYAELARPPFKVNKGTQLFTYADYAKGYQLTLWTQTQAEARRVIKAVLDIQQHKFDDDKFRIGSKTVTPKKAIERVQVLGQIEEVANIGTREGRVTFKECYINLGNGTKPINLIDLTGKKKTVFKPT